MTARTSHVDVEVLRREVLSDHLVRLVLGGPGLAGFVSTGIPDEWVGLVVPDQFQSRYYTVRSVDDAELVLDVVLHEVGLVTEWAQRDVVGQTVRVSDPKGSFEPPAEAAWVLLVGDLTAMPAMARICESTALPVRAWAETPDRLPDYLPDTVDVTWLDPPVEGQSALAEVVADIVWPEGEGYFWMAGESAQMRAVRKHVMRDRRLPSTHYDVMGYWRGVGARQPRSVDPGPSWRTDQTTQETP